MSEDESKKSSEPPAPEPQNPNDSIVPDTNIEHVLTDEELSAPDQFSFTTPPAEFDGGILAGVEIHTERRTRTVTGPIPSPEVMEGYRKIDSSFPQRIMAMAENESDHRRDLERARSAAMNRDMRDARVERRNGQFIAGLVAIAIMGAAVWVTLSGHPKVGGGLVASLVVAITVLVTGKPFRGQKNTENDENA